MTIGQTSLAVAVNRHFVQNVKNNIKWEHENPGERESEIRRARNLDKNWGSPCKTSVQTYCTFTVVPNLHVQYKLNILKCMSLLQQSTAVNCLLSTNSTKQSTVQHPQCLLNNFWSVSGSYLLIHSF